jgi:predicted thioesterase
MVETVVVVALTLVSLVAQLCQRFLQEGLEYLAQVVGVAVLVKRERAPLLGQQAVQVATDQPTL